MELNQLMDSTKHFIKVFVLRQCDSNTLDNVYGEAKYSHYLNLHLFVNLGDDG